METFNIIRDDFDASAESGQRAKVNMMWGANELDRSNVNFWNTTFKGDI